MSATSSRRRITVVAALAAGAALVAAVALTALNTESTTQPLSEPRNHSYLEKMGLADEGEGGAEGEDAQHPYGMTEPAGGESDEARVLVLVGIHRAESRH